MGKWFFKWKSERDRGWNKWVRDKYSVSHCSLGDCIFPGNTSDTMNDILSVYRIPEFRRQASKRNFTWSLKNGRSIFFQEDVWALDRPLMVEFRHLYSLSKLKESTVQYFMDSCHGSSLKLSRFWTRSLRSWEIEEIVRLEFVINQSRTSEGKDSLSWSVSKKIHMQLRRLQSCFNSHGGKSRGSLYGS